MQTPSPMTISTLLLGFLITALQSEAFWLTDMSLFQPQILTLPNETVQIQAKIQNAAILATENIPNTSSPNWSPFDASTTTTQSSQVSREVVQYPTERQR